MNPARQFAQDFRATTEWCAVADLRIARQERVRQLRRAFLTSKESRDIAKGQKVAVLAAAWDELGNIFALLPNGKRTQFIGR